MKVLLIRHGESIGNAMGIHQGQKNDFPLNEMGKKQANFLKKRLEDVKIDAVYSSDLVRANETAEFISQPRNLTTITDKRLRERDFGVIGEAKDIMKAWNNYLKEQINKGVDSREVTPINGESDKDHFDRVSSFFEDLKKNHKKDNTIAVVAHGGTNKVALGVIGHLPISKMYKTPQGNACINEFILKDGLWEAKSVNNMDHIEVDQDIINEFKKIRDEPLDFIKNRCWEKHSKLKKILDDKGYKTKHKICSFKWSEQNVPDEIIGLPHSDLDYHSFLEVKLNGLKLIVDASNDSLLPNCNNWDGKKNCTLRVIPEEFIDENIDEITKKKINESYSGDQIIFLNKLNDFLEGLREVNK